MLTYSHTPRQPRFKSTHVDINLHCNLNEYTGMPPRYYARALPLARVPGEATIDVSPLGTARTFVVSVASSEHKTMQHGDGLVRVSLQGSHAVLQSRACVYLRLVRATLGTGSNVLAATACSPTDLVL